MSLKSAFELVITAPGTFADLLLEEGGKNGKAVLGVGWDEVPAEPRKAAQPAELTVDDSITIGWILLFGWYYRYCEVIVYQP